MEKVKDIRTFLKGRKETDSAKLIKTASEDAVSQSEMILVENEVQKSTMPRQHYNKQVPEKMKREVGQYAVYHGASAAVKHFNQIYPNYVFRRTTVNSWKTKIKTSKSQNSQDVVFKKKGRPNFLSEDLLKKVKVLMIGTRSAGTAISRRLVVAIGKGIVKANNPKSLRENGGWIELTEDWARGIIKSMNWTKRKATTGKVEPSQQFLDEERLTYQKKISTAVHENDIPESLIVNLDQTPLSYVSPGKYTFDLKGSKTVPVKGIDDKRQITATFAISLSGEFLPLQVIYEGKTKRCLPKYQFPKEFDVTFSENHWSNTEKSVSFFENVIFPYFKKVRKAVGYPDEQKSLVIMDTFKGQDNEDIAKLCKKNHCLLVIVPHNLTNKFQPLDLTVNKPAKCFIKDLYNTWYADQVADQLAKGKAPADVDVSVNLTVIKPLHAKWITQMYDYLKGRKDLIFNGFRSAGITEAVQKANEVFQRIENPFLAAKNAQN